MRRIAATCFGGLLWALTFVRLLAFPSIITTATSVDLVSSTTHTISLPAGTVSGDLLLMSFYGSGQDGVPHSAATGWTTIGDQAVQDSVGHLAVLSRRADGSEGATVNTTTDVAENVASCVYRISGTHAITPPFINVGPPRGVSLNPDPGLLAAPWKLEDTTYIAIGGADSTNVDFTAYPTNYTLSQITIATHTAAGGACAMAARNYRSLSDDPDPFTIDTSNVRWTAFTVAVRNVAKPVPLPRLIL